MRIKINKLKFYLPEKPFGSLPTKLDSLAENVKLLERKAGTGNKKFSKAWSAVVSAIENNIDLADALDEPIKVRALAILLQMRSDEKIRLTKNVFTKIDQLRPTPSTLLIQSLYQHYLSLYDRLDYPAVVAAWLRKAMEKKGRLKDFHNYLLSDNGPKWLAEQCIANDREFSNQLSHLDLGSYSSGRFFSVAKRFYYVERLKVIPANQPDDLLLELQQRATFESRYDDKFLLGHIILTILIKRAPDSGVDDSWLNVIMAIAGDPRVPRTHLSHQKWWSRISPSLNTKVRGWLSRLDLRLFLEALKNYASHSGDDEIRRMFPSRKKFLEGLLDKELITNTRLYLSSGAKLYLRRNYKDEHLPNFSNIMGDSRSIIHVQLGKAHIIEGSHSCYLWIYPRLHPSAIVFDYEETHVRYSSLTGGLSQEMIAQGTPPEDNITHTPANFSWQRKAIKSLNGIGVKITPEDVLSKKDYSLYLRKHGMGYGLR